MAAPTLTTILSSCPSALWRIREGAEHIYSMVKRYETEPGVEHYACIVSVLSPAGKLLDAMEFISKMPGEPLATVWGALLSGACDRLFEMEPKNIGNYIIMACLYTQAGRWEEAGVVRDKMKKNWIVENSWS